MEKKDLRTRLAERYGSAGEWRGRETVVLHGVTGATVYGCQRIVTYCPSEICLLVGKRRVCVFGKGLYCASFAAGTVKVLGTVTGVLLNGREAGEC